MSFGAYLGSPSSIKETKAALVAPYGSFLASESVRVSAGHSLPSIHLIVPSLGFYFPSWQATFFCPGTRRKGPFRSQPQPHVVMVAAGAFFIASTRFVLLQKHHPQLKL